ncbi:hypothetical protein IMCC21906_00970 [Spongiibacter sp. IMCC21906]|nr:hypothetical protein IMCC21906_00970 [Spongiibacter sp. IMCC21906]
MRFRVDQVQVGASPRFYLSHIYTVTYWRKVTLDGACFAADCSVINAPWFLA